MEIKAFVGLVSLLAGSRRFEVPSLTHPYSQDTSS